MESIVQNIEMQKVKSTNNQPTQWDEFR